MRRRIAKTNRLGESPEARSGACIADWAPVRRAPHSARLGPLWAPFVPRFKGCQGSASLWRCSAKVRLEKWRVQAPAAGALLAAGGGVPWPMRRRAASAGAGERGRGAEEGARTLGPDGLVAEPVVGGAGQRVVVHRDRLSALRGEGKGEGEGGAHRPAVADDHDVAPLVRLGELKSGLADAADVIHEGLAPRRAAGVGGRPRSPPPGRARRPPARPRCAPPTPRSAARRRPLRARRSHRRDDEAGGRRRSARPAACPKSPTAPRRVVLRRSGPTASRRGRSRRASRCRRRRGARCGALVRGAATRRSWAGGRGSWGPWVAGGFSPALSAPNRRRGRRGGRREGRTAGGPRARRPAGRGRSGGRGRLSRPKR